MYAYWMKDPGLHEDASDLAFDHQPPPELGWTRLWTHNWKMHFTVRGARLRLKTIALSHNRGQILRWTTMTAFGFALPLPVCPSTDKHALPDSCFTERAGGSVSGVFV